MENLKRTVIEDDFISKADKHDNQIIIEACDDTLGNVMRWMAAYDKDEYDNVVTKENYRSIHADHEMNIALRFADKVIICGGGMLSNCHAKTNSVIVKVGYDANGNLIEYPVNTTFIDIVCEYANCHWDEKVRVVSYYSGCMGLLAITVFSEDSNSALFSFTAQELYGKYTAR